METLLSQLAVSLVTLSTLLSPTTAEASIMPYSMPTQQALIQAKMGLGLTEEQKTILGIIKTTCPSSVDCEKAYRIAKAETYFKNVCNYKYDGENGKFTACGVFQITRTTYRNNCGDPADRKDIEKNIQCAFKIMASKGYDDWLESASTWDI